MTKTFSFKTNNNTFSIAPKSTNYSKTLDDIIINDVIKKNGYLFNSTKKEDDANIFDALIGNTPIIINGSYLKADDKFTKAAKFLANYKSNKKYYNIPYILGKMYKLSDGTPIVFYDDEIMIGFDTYKYDDFGNISFLNGLTNTTKNVIINIFTDGISNIKINIF